MRGHILTQDIVQVNCNNPGSSLRHCLFGLAVLNDKAHCGNDCRNVMAA